MMKKRLFKIACVVICLVWIFLSVFAHFLPHEHCSSDADCAICCFWEECGNANAGAGERTVAILMIALAFAVYAFVPASRDETPVGRKVKLSD